VGDAGLRAVGPGDAIRDGADEVHGAVGSGCKVRAGGVQGARCAVGSGCSRAGWEQAGEGPSSSLLLSSMRTVASV
jgi:hypothetical protein